MLVLITGGARSGKSDYAMTLAGGRPGAKAFAATAEALDEEMALRIAKHRQSRPPDWEILKARGTSKTPFLHKRTLRSHRGGPPDALA
jgi:adenosyl cobinamide kinase/adenosyl cobinamide phosphate guanylyltransferase